MLKRILLVEDDAQDAELTLRALAEYKLANDVIVAKDAEEALDYLHHRGKFDGSPKVHPLVILLDLKLPKMDGLELLRKVKSDEATKSVPVVVLTSSRESPDLDAAYKAGANSYVVKPVDFHNFVDAVKQVGSFWVVLNEPPPGSLSKAPPPTQ